MAISTGSIRANSRTSHCECPAEPRITPLLLSCGFLFSSKMLKPQTNSSVFGSLQNLKEDKPKPVRDEYEYVSDEGELKIDEFPIRRKKNTVKRDQSCEYVGLIWWSISVYLNNQLGLGIKPQHFLVRLLFLLIFWSSISWSTSGNLFNFKCIFYLGTVFFFNADALSSLTHLGAYKRVKTTPMNSLNHGSELFSDFCCWAQW